MASSSAQNVQLNLKINGADAFNTLKDLNAHIAATKGKINKMNLDDPSYNHVAKNLRECTARSKELQKEIYGAQKASKGFFDDFKSGLGGIAGAVSVGTLIATGIQGAIGSVKAFFSNAQAAWVQGEQTQAQLAATIKSTGNAAGRTVEQLNQLSTELMHQTGINSDLIAQAEALLLTFTNISGEVYDSTLPVIVNMSKALGENLKNSAIRAGKALSDPISGFSELKEAGIMFSEEQKRVCRRLQETGDLAGAQKIILDELAKTFGGVAEAVSKTNSGQLEAFNTRIEKVQENIGGFITAIKAANLNALEPFIRLLEKFTNTTVSEKLEKEKMSLTAMRIELESSNTSTKRRLEIINELKTQYPAYLSKIDAEKTKNTDLLPILNKINEAFILRIAYQKRAEKMDDAIQKEADLMNEKYNKQQKQILQIAEIQERLAADGIKFTIKGRNENEKILFIQQHLTSAVREQAGYISGITYANMIASLTGSQIGVGRLTEKLKEQQVVRKAMADDLTKFKESNQLTEAPTDIHAGQQPKVVQEKVKVAIDPKKEEHLKAAKEKALQEFEKLGDEFKKLKIRQLEDSLAADQKEIQQEKDKYQTLIDEREKYLKSPNLNKEQKQEVKTQISTLKKDRAASVNTIEVRQEQDRITQLTELRTQFHVIKEKEVEKEIKLINKKYAELKEKAKGNAKAIALLEGYQATDLANAKIREEQRFQHEKKALQASGLTSMSSKEEQELADIQNKYDAKIELLKESFSEELQLTQEFQDQIAAIEAAKGKEIADKKLATKTEEAKKANDFLINTTQETANAVFSIASSNRQAETQAYIGEINRQREAELANKDLTEEQKKAINAKYDKQIAAEKLRAWQADKEASIAQAVINGALAFISALKMGPWAAAAVAVATALQMGVMVSQQPPKFAKGGQLPQGPTHANGGIALIAPNGQKVGEIEGGEPILSRETYANNRQLIDALLYSSQRLNGATIGINTREAIKADRMFRHGGIAPTTVNNTTNQVTNHATDLSILVHEIRDLKAAVKEEKSRPVEFNYRVLEAFGDKIDRIRAGVDA